MLLLLSIVVIVAIVYCCYWYCLLLPLLFILLHLLFLSSFLLLVLFLINNSSLVVLVYTPCSIEIHVPKLNMDKIPDPFLEISMQCEDYENTNLLLYSTEYFSSTKPNTAVTFRPFSIRIPNEPQAAGRKYKSKCGCLVINSHQSLLNYNIIS